MSENKSQKKRIWFITILILLVLLLISLFASERRGKIVYREYLSEDILTVDGEKLQLGDLAMYIAYEELKVEDEAAAYDYYDTNKYWNLHTSGRFVKEVAKAAEPVNDQDERALALTSLFAFTDRQARGTAQSAAAPHY